MITFQESAQNSQEWAAVERMIRTLQRPPDTLLAPSQEAIREGFDQNFRTESAGGVPWEPLAFSTVIDRVLLGYPGEHPILQRSGHYRSSFVDAVHADHVSVIEHRSDGVSLLEGTQDERAVYLERGRGRLPARPVLELSSASITQVENEFLEMVDKILNG